ncbi:MAG: twin-arginine translocase subunit TatC [Selenomonadales bacterium]|nr:twin-arginine translocase subunit TatC [Selenomonadales bacterium]
MAETPSELTQTQEVHDDEMSAINHLEELRRRLIISIVTVLVASGCCYFYAEEMVNFLTKEAGKLYYMNPAEAFFTYLKVSFFGGFLVSIPVLMHQFWAFVVPALTNQEKKTFDIIVPASVVLFFLGLAFSYFLVFPTAVHFFMGFSTDSLLPIFSIGQYLSFVIAFVLPFGFVFELPMIVLVLAKMGFLTSDFLKEKRKYVLVGAFVVGAIISPTPDIFSQCMIAIPMLLLYECSIMIVQFFLKK